MSSESPKKLTAQAEAIVLEAIRSAELRTSAEICVHVDSKPAGDPMEEAQRIFTRSGMDATRDRNAVLVYVSLTGRRFAFWGDRAAHDALGESGWQSLRQRFLERLATASVEHAIADAIGCLADRLAVPFPRRPDDVNELPDTIGGPPEA